MLTIAAHVELAIIAESPITPACIVLHFAYSESKLLPIAWNASRSHRTRLLSMFPPAPSRGTPVPVPALTAQFEWDNWLGSRDNTQVQRIKRQ